jgi:hypothetical protein
VRLLDQELHRCSYSPSGRWPHPLR